MDGDWKSLRTGPSLCLCLIKEVYYNIISGVFYVPGYISFVGSTTDTVSCVSFLLYQLKWGLVSLGWGGRVELWESLFMVSEPSEVCK